MTGAQFRVRLRYDPSMDPFGSFCDVFAGLEETPATTQLSLIPLPDPGELAFEGKAAAARIGYIAIYEVEAL